MKKSFFTLSGTALTGALVAFGASSASTQVAQAYVPPPPQAYSYYEPSHDSGFHLEANMGPSIMQDFNATRLGFQGRFSTDPGVRADIAPGYDFFTKGKLTLGADFETGFIYNRIDKVKVDGVKTWTRGDYYQLPFLGGLELKVHANSYITPYLGVAGGGDFSEARLRDPWEIAGAKHHDDRVDPAVQGSTGVRFRVTSNCQVGLGYKYLAALGSGGNKDTATHAVLASFNVNF
jgi:opacity protein-like surface antigen